jgi:hypothetical protein
MAEMNSKMLDDQLFLYLLNNLTKDYEPEVKDLEKESDHQWVLWTLKKSMKPSASGARGSEKLIMTPSPMMRSMPCMQVANSKAVATSVASMTTKLLNIIPNLVTITNSRDL